MKYGWPIGYNSSVRPQATFNKHKGAIKFLKAIDGYLLKQIDMGSMMGPFKSNPLATPLCVFPPLNSVPKNDNDCTRVVVAPYVRSVGHVFTYLYTLDDDSEHPMDYEFLV